MDETLIKDMQAYLQRLSSKALFLRLVLVRRMIEYSPDQVTLIYFNFLLEEVSRRTRLYEIIIMGDSVAAEEKTSGPQVHS